MSDHGSVKPGGFVVFFCKQCENTSEHKILLQRGFDQIYKYCEICGKLTQLNDK